MKTDYLSTLALACASLVLPCSAQVNSGSDGHDGPLNPTANLVIDMADHPDGIYHYTSVNIPAGVTVTFTPNAKNSPVVWLVQSNCVISGSISLSGQSGTSASSGGQGGSGGPGGWAGGHSGSAIVDGGNGFGPGGGQGGQVNGIRWGGGGGFADARSQPDTNRPGGAAYGNIYILPLTGGSGGGGTCAADAWPNGMYPGGGGGGGGGAICIAVSETLNLSGSIYSQGGGGAIYSSGYGSGGAIRLVASTIVGAGTIDTGSYGASKAA